MTTDEQVDYIDRQNEFYMDQLQARLEQECRGKWIVVHDERYVGAYETLDAAATEAVRRFGRGPYLIKRVGEPVVTPMPASLSVT